jgi:magnesium chelatase family protein
MLAHRLTTILPDMTLAEAIETTRLQSMAGLTGAPTAVVTTRPCRAPHHRIAAVGRIGGGQGPLPGHVSRAHHGMRWLDERLACRRDVLESLGPLLDEGLLRRPTSQVLLAASPWP